MPVFSIMHLASGSAKIRIFIRRFPRSSLCGARVSPAGRRPLADRLVRQVQSSGSGTLDLCSCPQFVVRRGGLASGPGQRFLSVRCGAPFGRSTVKVRDSHGHLSGPFELDGHEAAICFFGDGPDVLEWPRGQPIMPPLRRYEVSEGAFSLCTSPPRTSDTCRPTGYASFRKTRDFTNGALSGITKVFHTPCPHRSGLFGRAADRAGVKDLGGRQALQQAEEERSMQT